MFARIQAFGNSEEAQFSDREAREERLHLLSSNVLGNEEVREQLGAIWDECRLPGWDGYDARPLDRDALSDTYRLLEAMPLGSPPPSLGAEPDGSFTVEWHRSRRRTLSLSVPGNGELHYAALLGPNRICGTEIFSGDVPQRILDLIAEVTAHA